MLQIGSEIPSLLVLDRPVLHNGTEILQTDPLHVKAPRQAWAYAAAFEVHHARLNLAAYGEIAVELAMRVQTGEVCVSGLTEDLQEFVSSEVVVKPRAEPSVVRVLVSRPDKFRWLMLRNGSSGGHSSVFWLHSLSCYAAKGEEVADLVEAPVPELRNQLSSIILP
jgi:hypothetical protein